MKENEMEVEQQSNNITYATYDGPAFALYQPPKFKWKVTFVDGTYSFQTHKDTTWWFRFWVKFFFNGKWTRM